MDSDKNPITSDVRVVKTGISEVLGETWRLYKSNFWLFTGIYAIPAAIVIALEQFALPSFAAMTLGNMDGQTFQKQFLQMGGPVITAILIVIGIYTVNAVINFITYGAMLHAGARAGGDETVGGKASIGESFSFSLSRFWQGTILSVRIFFYSLAWIGFILMALLFGGLLAAAFGASAGTNLAQSLTSHYATAFGAFAVIGPIAIIVVAVLVFIRLLRVTFAYPILFADGNVSEKEALDKSIKLSKGLSGTVFLNYFLLGLMLAVIGGIYGGIARQIVMSLMPAKSAFSAGASLASVQQPSSFFNQVMAVASFPLMVVVGSIQIIFQHAFMKKAVEEKGMP